MKTTFLDKKIFIKTPTPKSGQVWLNQGSGDLFQIKEVNKNKTIATCEKENGFTFQMGFGWFDAKNNFFIGTL